jgi:hypothetical protein
LSSGKNTIKSFFKGITKKDGKAVEMTKLKNELEQSEEDLELIEKIASLLTIY